MDPTETNAVNELVERRREQVRLLCRTGLFHEAADLCVGLSDAVLLLTPCEAIADGICEKRSTEAARLYRIAADFRIFEGTQATGSGEGIAAMDALRRIEQKLKSLQAKDASPASFIQRDL